MPGSPKTPLDMSKWDLKIILFISNMHAGFFLYRTGLVITRLMLETDIIVTPTLNNVAPVDNRALNDKNLAPKHWCWS